MFDLRFWLIGLGVVGGGGGITWWAVDPLPAGVYRQPMAQAYQALAAADFRFRRSDLAGKAEVWSSVNGTDTIALEFSNEHYKRSCEIRLAPYDGRTDATTVNVTCGDRNNADQPMSRVQDELFANSVAESAHALLTGAKLRPLDEQLFEAAALEVSDGGEGGGFNRVLRDTVVMKRAIDDELDSMAAEQAQLREPTASESGQTIDEFYAEDAPADDYASEI